MAKRNVSLAAGVVAGVVLAMAVVTQALAHADYETSTPADGATVTTAPTQVYATFSADLETTGTNDLNVTNEASEDVDNNDVAIGPANAMTVTLQADLPNGTYTVAWSTTSAEDGEEDEGTFSFTIEAQAVPTTPASGTPDATATVDDTTLPSSGTGGPTSGSQGTLTLFAIGVASAGLLLAVLGFAGVTRRRI
ncbi:MAG: copper resistance protein CopC [Dehalococcoidia bacterium]